MVDSMASDGSNTCKRQKPFQQQESAVLCDTTFSTCRTCSSAAIGARRGFLTMIERRLPQRRRLPLQMHASVLATCIALGPVSVIVCVYRPLAQTPTTPPMPTSASPSPARLSMPTMALRQGGDCDIEAGFFGWKSPCEQFTGHVANGWSPLIKANSSAAAPRVSAASAAALL